MGACLVLFVALLVVGALAGGSKKQDTAATGSSGTSTSGTESTSSTATATSTSTTTSEPPTTASTVAPSTTTTAAPTTTTAAEPKLSRKTIPGIAAVDFYGNMRKIRWTCSGPNMSANLANWDCKDPADPIAFATVSGWSPTEIVKVQVMVSRSNASEVLGYVATLPYTGAEPAAAQAWVQSSLPSVSEGNPASTTFGGVPYELTGAGSTASLSIGKISDG